MPENESNATDPYGFADIEKIQKEIEDDLSKAQSVFAAELSSAPSENENEIEIENEIQITTEPIESEWPDNYADYAPPVINENQSEDQTDNIEAQAERNEDESIEASEKTAQDSAQVFYNETIKQPRKKKIRSWKKTVAVVCLVCTLGTGSLGLGIGAAIPFANHYFSGGNNQTENAAVTQSQSVNIASTRTVFGGDETNPREGSLSDVYKLVEPSVVGISSFFSTSDIFGRQQMGEATGIIYAEDAEKIFVATNSHVVANASSVNVTFDGGVTVAARLVGRDADADLAVISVVKSDLRDAGVNSIVIAVFGDSDKMEVGDLVMTVGNALGEGNSATLGIISAKEKDILIDIDRGRTLTVLQTDAAINFGNSGGPLVNIRGEVIGINTAKLTNFFYGVEGIGYSISSNVARPILEELMDAKPRPFLGIDTRPVTEELADLYGIPAIGVFVNDVIPGTGADKAGILRTDIITGFNGSPIFDYENLIAEIQKCEVGDVVEIKLLRDGNNPVTLEVTLGENINF